MDETYKKDRKKWYYNTKHDFRGIAVIFNHRAFENNRLEEREGTQKDGADLITVLEKLQFTVRDYKDKTLSQIRKILLDLSLEDHSKNDCLWVTVMSHGGLFGKISSYNIDYHIEELWQNFEGDRCSSLIGKPKLFFIQACRGPLNDIGVKYQSNDASDVQVNVQPVLIPRLSDFLVMYSAAENHKSMRCLTNGTWFIQALCKELETNSDEDLLCILTGVIRRVAFECESSFESLNKKEKIIVKQLPSIVTTLTKTLFFTPKKIEKSEAK